MTSSRLARLASLSVCVAFSSAWAVPAPSAPAAAASAPGPAKPSATASSKDAASAAVSAKAEPTTSNKPASTKPAPAKAPPPAPVPTDLPTWCKTIAERLTALPLHQCLNTGLQPGDGRSVRGIPLWFRDIKPASGAPRLRVLVLGGIHGDEMASVNLVFNWLERSVKSNNAPIHWRVVPLVNPDGLLRKPATRTNARGVDLNRNFPTADWATNARSYWISRTGKDPRRYPGPAAMSEPETRWVQRQLEQFKPNLIVSVHAPYGVLDFDGPPPPPDKLGNLYLDQVGIYPGSLGNYGGVVQRVPVVTLELKDARQIAASESAAMWTDLLGWIDRRLINVAQQGSTTKQP
ncbi:M14 family zinc carboxypeptidase [Ideonella paludis]|uniref:Succinylglutamate desuccinylase/aspartoacylase family protein n=1 Tax=Ideonella paludis TaxID=1233411 RepID=A0ABS5E037_9BURK|nr:M14 family zinc carboxypeptidase [Ideonella paludis]MBQ0936679.1 succinylglutamate desuccinylase/aspartoacylase family protein [Ideonella paludis]